MASRMRVISFSGKRGTDILHVEAPGCVINVRKNLRDTQGREVTRVDIKADEFSGEAPVSCQDVIGIDDVVRYVMTNYHDIDNMTEDDLTRHLVELASKQKFVGVRVIRELGEVKQ